MVPLSASEEGSGLESLLTLIILRHAQQLQFRDAASYSNTVLHASKSGQKHAASPLRNREPPFVRIS